MNEITPLPTGETPPENRTKLLDINAFDDEDLIQLFEKDLSEETLSSIFTNSDALNAVFKALIKADVTEANLQQAFSSHFDITDWLVEPCPALCKQLSKSKKRFSLLDVLDLDSQELIEELKRRYLQYDPDAREFIQELAKDSEPLILLNK